METNEIIKLMQAMNETGIDLLELTAGASQLKLKRHPRSTNDLPVAGQLMEQKLLVSDAPVVSARAAVKDEQSSAEEDESSTETLPGQIVTAPVVGIFFAAASPDTPPFTDLGHDVKTGDIVCIIEAMKLMNEVSSTASGKVLEVYAQNGQKVQYGDPLFRIG